MREEVQIILHKAEDFLQDARVLRKEEPLEGVINRSYYAVFTAVRALLFSKDEERQFSKL